MCEAVQIISSSRASSSYTLRVRPNICDAVARQDGLARQSSHRADCSPGDAAQFGRGAHSTPSSSFGVAATRSPAAVERPVQHVHVVCCWRATSICARQPLATVRAGRAASETSNAALSLDDCGAPYTLFRHRSLTSVGEAVPGLQIWRDGRFRRPRAAGAAVYHRSTRYATLCRVSVASRSIFNGLPRGSTGCCGCGRPFLLECRSFERYNSLESSIGELFSAELLLVRRLTTQPRSDLRFYPTSRPIVQGAPEHCCCCSCEWGLWAHRAHG